MSDFLDTRTLSELITREMARMSRGGEPFSLAYLGVDKDALLRYPDELASILLQDLRSTDQLGIINDETICIFFPATDETSVRHAMSRLNKSVFKVPSVTGMVVATCNGRGSFDVITSHLVCLLSQIKSNRRKASFVSWGAYTDKVDSRRK